METPMTADPRLMTHKIPLGTKLVMTLPLTEALTGHEDADQFDYFMPGIEGQVTCYVIGHEGQGCGDPDDGDYDPEYVLSPYKEHKTYDIPMWEHFTQADQQLRDKAAPNGWDPEAWQNFTILDLCSHRIQRGVPESCLRPFHVASVVKTEGVCGGSARLGGTRITVRTIVEFMLQRTVKPVVLKDGYHSILIWWIDAKAAFPAISIPALEAARSYYIANQAEIDAEITANAEA